MHNHPLTPHHHYGITTHQAVYVAGCVWGD